MPRFLILCQNPALSASLGQWLVSKGFAQEGNLALKAVGEQPGPTEMARAFDELAGWLEKASEDPQPSSGVPHTVVLTDLAGYGAIAASDLNPVKNHGWATVLGMLILAFPEVHWVVASGSFAQELGHQIEHWHSGTNPNDLQRILTDRRMRVSFLFDGSGLRDAIRLAMGTETDRSRVRLPQREKLAIAVDEESSYAWLHAYTAYRFGFRAHAVTTLQGMRHFLGSTPAMGGQAADKSAAPDLVFEDIFLHFSDEHPEKFSLLRARDVACPWLARAPFRVLVTSGHHHGQDDEAHYDNPHYLAELRDGGQWNCERQKPLGGIFNLWEESQLQTKLREGGRPGLASGFIWPLVAEETEAADAGGHSAPGRILVVADRLVGRTRSLAKDGVSSVTEAVFGAVLATDALELLGGKTPTTSLEALALKHQFEVLAECHFVGMQEHIEVRSRITDIERGVDAIGHWFGRTKGEGQTACWNAELTILNRVIDVLQTSNQFDEEQAVQATARRLHRKLWFQKRCLLKPFEFAPAYVEKLVASFPLFLCTLVGWIVVLGFAFWWAGSGSPQQGWADAFSTFLSIQPPANSDLWKPEHGWNGSFCLVAFTMVLGFVHLGIFISHLYTLVSRK